MKKTFLIIATLVFFSSCNGAGPFRASLYWAKNIVKPLTERGTYELKITEIYDDTTTWSYTILKPPEAVTYVSGSDFTFAYRFGKDTMQYVSETDAELMAFPNAADADLVEAYRFNYITGNCTHFECLINPKDVRVMDSMKDTVVDGTPYKVFHTEDKQMYCLNEETGEYDIPDFFNVYYYYNTETKQLEYLRCVPFDPAVSEAKIVRIEYNYDVDMKKYQQMFDFSNPKYSYYTRHNEDFHPYSWTWSSERSSELSDTVLNFPVVLLNGDTTTIGEMRGWVLLDFWHLNCPGCMRWFRTLQHEKDSLGTYALSKQGIRIVSINALSDNTELIGKVAQKYGTSDITAHAKGIANIFDMHVMPQYYLLSPDKRIVYKSDPMADAAPEQTGDYDALLKAKQAYRPKQ